MKKILGILLLSCVCILLGLSVRWSREKNISLVSLDNNTEICHDVL